MNHRHERGDLRTCWILGFAHRSGQLQRFVLAVLGMLAGGCVALGAVWAVTHAESEHPDLNGIPLGTGVYSLGFVPGAAALVTRPELAASGAGYWMPPSRCSIRGRVTTYLWHNVAIAVCFSVGDLTAECGGLGAFAQLGYFGIAMVLVVGAVLALGWGRGLRRPAPATPAAGEPANPTDGRAVARRGLPPTGRQAATPTIPTRQAASSPPPSKTSHVEWMGVLRGCRGHWHPGQNAVFSHQPDRTEPRLRCTRRRATPAGPAGAGDRPGSPATSPAPGRHRALLPAACAYVPNTAGRAPSRYPAP